MCGANVRRGSVRGQSLDSEPTFTKMKHGHCTRTSAHRHRARDGDRSGGRIEPSGHDGPGSWNAYRGGRPIAICAYPRGDACHRCHRAARRESVDRHREHTSHFHGRGEWTTERCARAPSAVRDGTAGCYSVTLTSVVNRLLFLSRPWRAARSMASDEGLHVGGPNATFPSS